MLNKKQVLGGLDAIKKAAEEVGLSELAEKIEGLTDDIAAGGIPLGESVTDLALDELERAFLGAAHATIEAGGGVPRS